MAYLIIYYYFLFIEWYWKERGASPPLGLPLETIHLSALGAAVCSGGVITQAMNAGVTRELEPAETEAPIIQIKSKWS